MAIVNKKNNTEAPATQAQAFCNWTALDKNGVEAIKSSKGFAIFDNQYTSKQERMLVDLATKNGGEITLNMKVVIRLNEQKDAAEVDLSNFL